MVGPPGNVDYGCGLTRFSRIGIADSNGFGGSIRPGRPGCANGALRPWHTLRPSGAGFTGLALRAGIALSAPATAATIPAAEGIAGTEIIFAHTIIASMIYFHVTVIPFHKI